MKPQKKSGSGSLEGIFPNLSLNATVWEILILEGPAGAGKSTLGQRIKDELERDVYLIEPTFPKRNRTSTALDSLHKDLYRTIEFLSILLRDPDVERSPLFLFDRWFFSQLVYGTLRGEIGSQLFSQHLGNLKKSIFSLLSQLALQLWLRESSYTPQRYRLSINLLLLLPEISQLQSQRELAGKRYPYRPEAELVLYQRLAELLTLEGPDPLRKVLIVTDPDEGLATVKELFDGDILS